MLNDLRLSVRLLRKTPAFTLIAVLSLAIGVGAATTVFSLIDAIGFRPLGVPDEGRLVRVFSTDRREPRDEWSYPEFLELSGRQGTLESVAAHGVRGVAVSTDGAAPDVMMASIVSGGFFRTLGIRPALGRPLTESDDRAGAAPVVLVSHRVWQRRFGADPALVGRTIRVDSLDCTVIGVMPSGFTGSQPLLVPDVYLPINLWPTLLATSAERQAPAPGPSGELTQRGRRWLSVTARLRAEAGIEQARAEAVAMAQGLAQAYPETNRGRGADVVLESAARRGRLQVVAALVLGVVGLVLVVACANVAGLMLGRAELRRRDLAIRLAVGAGRGHVIRQLLAEAAVLALLALLAGVLLATWLMQLVPSLMPPSPIPLSIEPRLDTRVLAFSLAVAALTVPLFGLLPALIGSRTDLTPLIRSGSAAPGRGRRVSLRDGLVVGQVAVSVLLLVVGGLMLRGLAAVHRTDPGFDRAPMLIATIAPQTAGYSDARSRAVTAELLERLRMRPEVESVAVANRAPLSPFGGGFSKTVEVPGDVRPAGTEEPRVLVSIVDAAYFRTLGATLVRGRSFRSTDGTAEAESVVVSQAMAARYWPGQDPVGRRFHVERREVEVIGVVRDLKVNSLSEEAGPHLYLPWSGWRSGDITILIRVRGAVPAASSAFRHELAAIDAGVPMLQMVTLEEQLALSLHGQRASVLLSATLGLAGLLLSMVGLYAIVAHLVSRRAREIGIRMALGARPSDVMRAVLKRGLVLSAVGLGLGAAGGVAAGRSVGSLLFGVGSTDPLTLGSVAAIVAVVTVAATWLPAVRATRVDPVTAVRTE